MHMRKLGLVLCLSLAALSLAFADLPRKGWLGAQIQPITDDQRKANGNPKSGILIGAITPGGTASTGLKQGDILTWLDGNIDAPQQVVSVFSKHLPGTKLEARVMRGGKEEKLTLTVQEKPRDKGENYEVLYDSVTSHGHEVRLLVSKPRATGKRPVMFLIQGIGYSSMDVPLSGQGPYSRILKHFSDKGFVTVRVEKPGLGDSAGGPANTVDFERDLDTFRQGMKAVFSGKYDFMDTANVFIFGHSMGGCEGPVVASEFPVRGLAVYGTVVRTWEEYCIQNTRRQAILGGESYEKLDKDIRKFMAAQSLLMTGGMSAEDIKTKFPQFAEGVDMFTPDGKTMSGMPLAFWRQCFQYNFADYWQKLNCNVLSLWGETEFIASYEDHPLIAEIVNKKRPGTAEYKLVPQSDHGFKQTATMKESFEFWGKPGKDMNPIVITMLDEWVMANLKK